MRTNLLDHAILLWSSLNWEVSFDSTLLTKALKLSTGKLTIVIQPEAFYTLTLLLLNFLLVWWTNQEGGELVF